MAEESDNEDRTFDATPRRREEARSQGRYPFSPDLSGSTLLLAGVGGMILLGPWMGANFLQEFRTGLGRLPPENLDSAGAQELLLALFVRGLTIVGGLLAMLLLTATVVGIVQAGLHLSAERLEPDFERLSPATGLKRLFSVGALVKGLFAMVKIALLGYLAYSLLRGRAGTLLSLGHDSLMGAASTAWKLVMRIALTMAAAMTAVGLADYVYQYRKFEGSLRMTREEFIREQKEEDGDPQIKARRRQIARDRMRRKMLAAIPKATVVVTNPTHYAVALRYEQGRDPAPILVAKGSGAFARRIAAIARDNQVPVLERPELARAIFRAVREDQEVPAGLFLAVAEVIAFVYRLRGGVRR